MINEVNKKIINMVEELKPYRNEYSIDEFLEEYDIEENIFELSENDIILISNNNENDFKSFEDGVELYMELETNKDMYSNYYVSELISIYSQIDNVVSDLYEYITNDFDEEEQIEIVRYIANCYKDTYSSIKYDELVCDKLEIIDSDDYTLLYNFYNNEDFSSAILLDYCHMVYENHESNVNYDDNEITCKSISDITIEKILLISSNISENVQNKTELYNVLQIYFSSFSKEEQLFKKYAILIIVYNYYICNINNTNINYKQYINYIKLCDINDIFMLFKNDLDFVTTALNNFFDVYLYKKILYDKRNLIENDKENIKRLFYPMYILDNNFK